MLLSPVEASTWRNRRRETAPHPFPSASDMSRTLYPNLSQFSHCDRPVSARRGGRVKRLAKIGRAKSVAQSPAAGAPMTRIFRPYVARIRWGEDLRGCSTLPFNRSRPKSAPFCVHADCTQTHLMASLNQVKVPARAVGHLFGPGMTVGIPFAAQTGFRKTV